ncbi:hypothetical protein [Carnobacterium maltaromaticum]|uniref:hypothetical protein n=1 Tax=Carnobacterium maltaromaticum TaxID=2751 RepID=UPI00295F1D8E|nr:hypothetical protein [Carnobacterium maltaromaticum]
MRENQVTIRIERFGDGVPDEFQEYKLQVMEVYADGNDLYETLCGAFRLALNEVEKYGKKCSGTKDTYNSLELTKYQSKIFHTKREIENDNLDSSTTEE